MLLEGQPKADRDTETIESTCIIGQYSDESRESLILRDVDQRAQRLVPRRVYLYWYSLGGFDTHLFAS